MDSNERLLAWSVSHSNNVKHAFFSLVYFILNSVIRYTPVLLTLYLPSAITSILPL